MVGSTEAQQDRWQYTPQYTLVSKIVTKVLADFLHSVFYLNKSVLLLFCPWLCDLCCTVPMVNLAIVLFLTFAMLLLSEKPGWGNLPLYTCSRLVLSCSSTVNIYDFYICSSICPVTKILKDQRSSWLKGTTPRGIVLEHRISLSRRYIWEAWQNACILFHVTAAERKLLLGTELDQCWYDKKTEVAGQRELEMQDSDDRLLERSEQPV